MTGRPDASGADRDTALSVDSLTKRFGTRLALDRLTLSVPRGAIHGFLGPNGAGKTTTFRLLTGLSRPESGTIRIFGQRVSFGSSAGRECIGYLPDVPDAYPFLRPMEFLDLCGRLGGLSHREIRTRSRALLDLVGLPGETRRIGSFSRGMKQRLGLAQAIFHQPELVLLDEPVSALDPSGRKEILDLVGSLSRTATVFFSTHILADVERVCDRVSILHEGRCLVDDTMAGLRARFPTQGIRVRVHVPVGSAHPPHPSVDPSGEPGCAPWLAPLAALPDTTDWCDRARIVDDTTVDLTVRDRIRAGILLPRLLADTGISLDSFAPLEPSLEDIFLRVVTP